MSGSRQVRYVGGDEPRAPGARRAVRVVLLVAALVLVTTGCNRIFGVSLSGTWSGDFRSTGGDSGLLLLTLEVAGGDVTGTWEASFSGSIDSGTLSGVADEFVSLILTPSGQSACTYSLVADQTREELEGTYSSSCSPSDSGTFKLKKR